MRALLILVLALLATSAHADGVELFTVVKPDAAMTARIAKAKQKTAVASMEPVTINVNALESTVINVLINGKRVSFVGAKVETLGLPELDAAWSGRSGDSWLNLSRDKKTKAVYGSIDTGRQRYTVGQMPGGGSIFVTY